MRENVFIRQNLNKWAAMQRELTLKEEIDPDVLAQNYRCLVSDLAYAQTHYPTSRVTVLLNDLAVAYHVRVYRRRPSTWGRFRDFWLTEIPLTLYTSRRELLTSLAVFFVGIAIGIVSQTGDAEFVRIILGDSYVDMTLDNIKAGTPMAVYDGGNPSDMFLGITLNNIFVALRCFSFGVLTLFGTGMMLLYNAIMLGSFQTFFAQHGLLWDSSLAVWLHGTIEISAIIVAGAGGVALGTGWLYPGTYSRREAFRRGAYRGFKLVSATVPMFIVAGFIEGFFTRHTHWPDALRLSIILVSAICVVLYIIVIPQFVATHVYDRKPFHTTLPGSDVQR